MEFENSPIQSQPESEIGQTIIKEAIDAARPQLELLAPAGFSMVINFTVKGYEHFECTYPEAWQLEYDEKSYYSSDPVLLWALFSTGDKRWTDIMIPDLRRIGKKAEAHGLKYGVVCARKTGAKRSFLSMARGDRAYSTAQLVEASEFATTFFDTLVLETKLNEGELQILQLLADGKNLKEAGEYLATPESTIKTRLSRARRKLNCETNYKLIASAMRAKLIE